MRQCLYWLRRLISLLASSCILKLWAVIFFRANSSPLLRFVIFTIFPKLPFPIVPPSRYFFWNRVYSIFDIDKLARLTRAIIIINKLYISLIFLDSIHSNWLFPKNKAKSLVNVANVALVPKLCHVNVLPYLAFCLAFSILLHYLSQFSNPKLVKF